MVIFQKLGNWIGLNYSNDKALEFHPSVIDSRKHQSSYYWILYIRVIAVFLILLMVAAYCFKTDIIVQASGSIMPDGKTKLVQAPIGGIIDEAFAIEGEKVREGQVLIELDQSDNRLMQKKLDQQLDYVRAEREGLRLILNQLETKGSQKIEFRKVLSDSGIPKKQTKLYLSEYQTYISNLEVQQKKIQQAMEKKESARNRIIQLKSSLPLYDEKVLILEKAVEKGLLARLHLIDAIKEKMEELGKIGIEEYTYREAVKDVAVQHQALSLIELQFKNELTKRITDLGQRIRNLYVESEQNLFDIGLHRIVSPVSGYIHQLEVSTKREVVRPGQKLMEVIPKDVKLVVVSYIKNKDIGLVKHGQMVRVKVDAFPFLKYGTIEGKIVNVSRDVVFIDASEPVFKATISLMEDSLYFNSRWMKLIPGMTVIAEINVGRRSIVEYVTDPIFKSIKDSFREP